MPADIAPDTTDALNAMDAAVANYIAHDGLADIARLIVDECADLHTYATISVPDLVAHLSKVVAAAEWMRDVVTNMENDR